MGSSPLTRGKLREIAQLHEGGGLIPAHAGKTCLPRRRCISHGAHPRSRGENRCSGAGGRSSSGSSPLTRGKRHHPVLQRVRGRLIPAHAGKTFQAELEMIQDRAHPRSRGENPTAYRGNAANAGSSPLTRGKPLRGLPGAGPEVAHPRSRGENARIDAAIRLAQGSSPLTRGKPHRIQGQRGKRGLIPAHAGKTLTRPPRSRTRSGSSPLTRGKRAD